MTKENQKNFAESWAIIQIPMLWLLLVLIEIFTFFNYRNILTLDHNQKSFRSTTTTRLAAVEQQIAEINEFHHDLFDPEPEIAHGKLIPLEETK